MKYLYFISCCALQIHGREAEPHAHIPREFKLGISWAYKSNPHFFTGRDDILERVHSVLQESAGTDGHPKHVVLTGLSGVGKTEIALEYAYRHQKTYASTFWIDGSSESAAVSSVVSNLKKIQLHYEHHWLHFNNPRYDLIAKAVRDSRPGLERRADCNITPIMAFRLWLSVNRNRSWLLILDNVDDLESWDYRSVLPKTQWGAIIITSKRSDLALSQDDSIQVDEMDEHTAISLLSVNGRLRLIEDATASEMSSARELVNKLGYLPLSIVQAAAYIFQHQITVADYLELFSSRSRSILSTSIPIASEEEKTYPVLVTWDLSFEGVLDFNPMAARILMVCAYLSPHDISSLLLQEGMELNRSQVVDSVLLLDSYTVAENHGAGFADGSFALHPSVQLWAKYRLDSRTQSELRHEALKMLHKFYSLHGHEDQEWMGQTLKLGPHVARLVYLYRDEVSQCNARLEYLMSVESLIFERGTLTTHFSWTMWASGKVTEAQNYAVHQISRIRQTETHLPPWQLLHNLRHMLSDGDRINLLAWVVCEAQRLYYSLSHPVVLDLLGDYADALQDNFQHDAAYKYYKWLLEARTKILGVDHPGTSAVMSRMGRSSSDCSGRMRQLTAAASLRMRNLGREDPRTRDAMFELSKSLCGCRRCLAVGVCTGGYEASTLVLEWLFPEYQGRPPWESNPGAFKESLDRVFQMSEKEVPGAFTHCDGLLLADMSRQVANNAGVVETGWAIMRPFFEFTVSGWCCYPDTLNEIQLTALDIGADVAISWIIKNMEAISHSPTLLRQVIATMEESYENGLAVPFQIRVGYACLLSRYSFIIWLLYIAEGNKGMADLWLSTAISPNWEGKGIGSDFAGPWVFAGTCVNHDEFDGHPLVCGKLPSGRPNMPPQLHYAEGPKGPPLLVYTDLLGRLFNSLPGRSSRHDEFVEGVDNPFNCDTCVGYALLDPVITMKSMQETRAAGWLFLRGGPEYGCQKGEFKKANLEIKRFLDQEDFFGLRRDIWESLGHSRPDTEDASTSCFSDIRLWQMYRA